LTYVCLLEVAHDGVDRVVPGSEASQQDALEVEFEDRFGDVDKELVRGGDVSDGRAGLHFHFLCPGQQVRGVLHLQGKQEGR